MTARPLLALLGLCCRGPARLGRRCLRRHRRGLICRGLICARCRDRRFLSPQEKRRELLGRERPREVEALCPMAPQRTQLRRLRRLLHALGHHRQIERISQGDHRAHDRVVPGLHSQSGDEGAIDLHGVHRESLQVGQGGVPRAEVVDRQLHPVVREHTQVRDHRLGGVDEHSFGHLQAEIGQRHLGSRRRRDDLAGHRQIGGLASRDVDGHLEGLDLPPPGELGAGLGEHPGPDRHDQVAVLCDLDELTRPDQATTRVLDPQQRLCRDDPFSGQIDHRLEVQTQPPVLQRVPKIVLHGHPPRPGVLQTLVEHLHPVPPPAFRLVHGGVRPVEQALGVRLRMIGEGQPHAGGDPDPCTVGVQRCVERLHQSRGDRSHLGVALELRADDDELVPADPARGVLRARGDAEPPTDLCEEPVPDLVSEGVVDVLEVVQVEVDHADGAPALDHRA